MSNLNNKSLNDISKNSDNTNISRFSVFTISENFFGIELSNVKEVITLPKITKLPGSANNIIGVFNLRGTILTLLKINKIIGLEEQDSDESMVLIVEYNDQLTGLQVEKVFDVINVEESNIQLPSREMPQKMAQNILGFYEKEGMGKINLINLNKLLETQNFS